MHLLTDWSRNTALMDMSTLYSAKALRDESIDRAADRFPRLTAEHLFGGGIEQDDPAIFAEGDDRIHRRRNDGLKVILAFTQGLLSSFSLGDIHED